MKTKENLLIKYIFCSVAVVAVFVFGVACLISSSTLTAHAKEISYNYTLEIGIQETSDINSMAYATDTMTSDVPLAIYKHPVTGMTCVFVQYKDNVFEEIVYFYSGVFTRADGTTFDMSGIEPSYFMASSSLKTNIPIFETEAEALAYYAEGDTSGLLNQADIDELGSPVVITDTEKDTDVENGNGSEAVKSGHIDMGIVEALIYLCKACMVMLAVFPINLMIIGSFIVIGFSIFRNAKKSTT